MNILSKYTVSEQNIKGSRFLSELFPCSTQKDARDILKAQKTKYKDATHVVHAFIIGDNAEISGISDDGEPSGTAGRPILDILRGNGTTNLILTVTRWFGGTLLGTGGLVKAYGSSAKQVLEKAATENAIEEFIPKTEIFFSTDYNLYKLIKLQMKEFCLFDVEENFGTEIKINCKIKSSELEQFSIILKNLSKGKILINC
jgi:uncharacterized YigZ family protein